MPTKTEDRAEFERAATIEARVLHARRVVDEHVRMLRYAAEMGMPAAIAGISAGLEVACAELRAACADTRWAEWAAMITRRCFDWVQDAQAGRPLRDPNAPPLVQVVPAGAVVGKIALAKK